MEPKIVDYIPLTKVPPILRELTGVTRTRVTIYHWVKHGRISAHGEMIKLKTYRRLGQIYTTKDAVIKFLRELG